MKPWLAALLFTLATSAAANGQLLRTVDLDDPGALEKLQASNPRHFAKLERLLQDRSRLSEPEVERFIRTAGGTAVRRGNLLKTSYPAKARLRFLLDNTNYVVTVTVRDPRLK